MAPALVAFILSGAAALMYQVVWQRTLALFSGVHAWSITVIVTAYMVGLGFGSLAGGRLADRVRPTAAVRLFAACELAVALFGAASPWVYYDLAYTHLGAIVRYPAALPLLHFVLLVVPTSLMGASLPLLAKGLVASGGRDAARTVARLYGANTLGAALGAFATTWWIAEAIGFAGTMRVAAALNVTAGALALLVRPPAALSEETRGDEAPSDGAGRWEGWVVLYGVSGFVALALEMVWLRVLMVTTKASPHAFGHGLGVLLLGLGLGGLAGAWLVRRESARQAGRMFLALQWAGVAAAALPFVSLRWLLGHDRPLRGFYQYLSSDSPLPMPDVPPEGLVATLHAGGVWILWPLVVMVPCVFAMGMSYAWIQCAVQTSPQRVGWRVGLIQAANVIGCALGSAVTGLWLYDALGSARTLQLLAAAGALYAWGFGRQEWRRWPAIVLSLVLAVGVPGPRLFWPLLHGVDPSAAVVAEDASGVVSMQPMAGTDGVMRVNGFGHSIVPYTSAWALLAALPVMAHGDARRVLVIGMGTGTTSWAAAQMPGVESIDLYEIARAERRALAAWEARGQAHEEVRDFLRDPRIRTSFADGRLALRLEPGLYDVVEADAAEPYMAYSGNLYSLEFFREVRRRLSSRGVFCTYVPTARVAETVKAAFPFVVDVRSRDLRLMLASNTSLGVDRDLLRRRFEAASARGAFAATPRGRFIQAELRERLREIELTPLDAEAPRQTVDLNTDLFPRDELSVSFVP